MVIGGGCGWGRFVSFSAFFWVRVRQVMQRVPLVA